MTRVARDDRERGAVLVMTALCVSVCMIVASFAVDYGRAMVLRRDLQKVADIAALDSSRFLDGTSASAQLANIRAAAVRSAARNDVNLDASRVHLVREDGTDFVVIDTSNSEVPDGVLVEARGHVDHFFQPGGTSTQRDAVATRGVTGGVQIGTSLANVDTSQATMLNRVFGLLGGNSGLNLSLVSWQGLANGTVTLGSLAAAAGNTESAFLSSTATLGQQLQVVANALTAEGQSSAAATVTQLRTSLSASAAAIPVRMGDLLVVSGADAENFAGVGIDLVSLLRGTLLLARDGGAVSGTFGSGVLGIADVSLTLNVVEPPQIALGGYGVTAKTGQVAVVLDTSLSIASVHLAVAAATGTATLTNVTCASGGGASSANARVQTQLGGLSLSLAGVPLAWSVPAVNQTNETFWPPFTWANRRHFGATSINLAASLTSGLGGLGVLLSGLVSPLLAPLEQLVVSPLLSAVGVTVAGADVAVLTPSCSPPRLVR